jgi:hypothetical protein
MARNPKPIAWWSLALWACASPGANRPAVASPQAADRPFLAIWRDSDGYVRESQAPYLRVAIWADGRVLFAPDASKWKHDLVRGRIAPYRIERLKRALRESGVFELKGHCYLGPDLPTDCIAIDLGEQKQMLYWYEGQTAWMQGKPHRMEFIRCWNAVNHLALVACPDQFEPVSDRFPRPPDSWYLKKAIQSE